MRLGEALEFLKTEGLRRTCRLVHKLGLIELATIEMVSTAGMVLGMVPSDKLKNHTPEPLLRQLVVYSAGAWAARTVPAWGHNPMQVELTGLVKTAKGNWVVTLEYAEYESEDHVLDAMLGIN